LPKDICLVQRFIRLVLSFLHSAAINSHRRLGFAIAL
jgi:hypothetical protein